MKVIDFHSHILPGIDDGSRNTDTSLKMLAEAGKQGVDVMIATPHYYSRRQSIEHFIEARENSYQHLLERIESLDAEEKKSFPEIRIGAETAWFEDIRHFENLFDLTIRGTNVLLLELPYKPWNDKVLRDVEILSTKRDLTIVLAHLERFYGIKENRSLIPDLMQLPLKVQVNAESLTSFFGSRNVLRWIREDRAHLLGSDCHNLSDRCPNLGAGRAVIEKKLGRDVLARMDEQAERLLH